MKDSIKSRRRLGVRRPGCRRSVIVGLKSEGES
jgi:hypothetical protein